ncbi:TIGR02234 family membrane protein [Rhodococcus spelaei]|uniref:TIGR02234 family membrane protein n=1 Tax=Rhodococcus spelaei TaxID=2546320 RepID=A0A541AZD0_9NOCA|nr:TIGR02234 family membrane protein [Rhodococcus spelaei]TQF65425.1 TIGR02234 family membrane protein [Rhodococcus spelaei]
MSDRTPTGDADAPSARRSGLAAALPVLLLAAAALCLWASSRMTWVSLDASDGLGEARRIALIGGTWAAATTPLALTLLAAIAASFAVRGWALRIVGVLVAAVAVAAAIPAATLLIEGADRDKAGRLAELPARAEVTATATHAAPALLALLGAVLALAAAVALIRKASVSAGLSSKYAAPAARREEATKRRGEGSGEPPSQRTLWDALDAGQDPTEDGPSDQAKPDDSDDTDTRR